MSTDDATAAPEPETAGNKLLGDGHDGTTGHSTDGEKSRTAGIGDLYHEHAGSLMGFLVNRIPSRMLAEDLSQDFWLKLHTRLHLFDGSNFRAWAFQVLRNQIIDAGRKKKPSALAEALEPIAGDTLHDEREERTRALRACIKELPEPPRSTVMAWLSGRDYQTMSRADDVPMGTVASRMNRAKKQLAECVKGRLS